MINPKAETSVPRCQKCLQTGHWTFDCTEKRAYRTRPSRTAQLLASRLGRQPSSTQSESKDDSPLIVSPSSSASNTPSTLNSLQVSMQEAESLSNEPSDASSSSSPSSSSSSSLSSHEEDSSSASDTDDYDEVYDSECDLSDESLAEDGSTSSASSGFSSSEDCDEDQSPPRASSHASLIVTDPNDAAGLFSSELAFDSDSGFETDELESAIKFRRTDSSHHSAPHC